VDTTPHVDGEQIAASEEAIDVHPDAPISMFVAAVWQQGGIAVFHEAMPELDLRLELV